MQNLPDKPRTLPKIDDLYADRELASQQNELNRLLNQPPNPKWLKDHPTAKGVKYLPIGIIEYLLTAIYLKYKVEIIDVKILANSVTVTVRLGVQNPLDMQWEYQDGIGAAPIQTNAGAAATDFTQVKSNAIQIAAPAAESYALKDAAEKLGKLFGRDLNRKDEPSYSVLDTKFTDKKEILPIPEELRQVIALADANNLVNIRQANPEYHSNPEFMKILNDRKKQINGTVAI